MYCCATPYLISTTKGDSRHAVAVDFSCPLQTGPDGDELAEHGRYEMAPRMCSTCAHGLVHQTALLYMYDHRGHPGLQQRDADVGTAPIASPPTTSDICKHLTAATKLSMRFHSPQDAGCAHEPTLFSPNLQHDDTLRTYKTALIPAQTTQLIRTARDHRMKHSPTCQHELFAKKPPLRRLPQRRHPLNRRALRPQPPLLLQSPCEQGSA